MKKLVNGRIPANTECPFKEGCIYSDQHIGESLCKHEGEEHEAVFSCATARSLEILAEVESKEHG